jgi:hypothetical protein
MDFCYKKGIKVSLFSNRKLLLQQICFGISFTKSWLIADSYFQMYAQANSYRFTIAVGCRLGKILLQLWRDSKLLK